MTDESNPLLEELAALEHEQWVYWTQNLADREELPDHLIDRWESNWEPYDELDEETKEHDRKWARKVVERLDEQDEALERRLWEFVANTHDSAGEVEARGDQNQDYANGVCAGMRWVAYELQAILDDGGDDE